MPEKETVERARRDKRQGKAPSTIAAKLIDAAKANNSSEVETQKAAWNANADEISGFLSAANSRNWPRSVEG